MKRHLLAQLLLSPTNNNKCSSTKQLLINCSSSSSSHYHTNHNRSSSSSSILLQPASSSTTSSSNITPRIKYLHKDYRKSHSINESHNVFDIEYNKIRQSLSQQPQQQQQPPSSTPSSSSPNNKQVGEQQHIILLSQGYSLGKAYKYQQEGDDEKLYGGEDAFFIQDNNILTHHNNPYQADFTKSLQSIGVADGVGGWSDIGHDASLISRQLMQNCFFYSLFNGRSFFDGTGGNDGNGSGGEKISQKLMERSYGDIVSKKQVVAGSTTCCVLSLENDQLHAANIGDSGFLLLRLSNNLNTNNTVVDKEQAYYEILAKSTPQQHYHNAPYQLSIIPQYLKGKFEDSVSDAICSRHQLQHDDLIVLATDGLFDNLYDREIVEFINRNRMQSEFYLAKQLVLKARNVAFGFEVTRSTPFQDQCEKHGFYYVGGKPDDITVVIARVKFL